MQEYARDPFRDDVWDGLAAGIRYVAADFADDGAMDKLLGLLSELDEERGTRGNRLYYLAVPPRRSRRSSTSSASGKDATATAGRG